MTIKEVKQRESVRPSWTLTVVDSKAAGRRKPDAVVCLGGDRSL